MERRKFTREFKLEAVRLIKDRGVSYAQASQDLNVHPAQLTDWVKKFSDDPQHVNSHRPPSASSRRATNRSGVLQSAKFEQGRVWFPKDQGNRPGCRCSSKSTSSARLRKFANQVFNRRQRVPACGSRWTDGRKPGD